MVDDISFCMQKKVYNVADICHRFYFTILTIAQINLYFGKMKNTSTEEHTVDIMFVSFKTLM